MIILPINSVINPLLYDDVITGTLMAPLHIIAKRISNTAIYQSFISHFSATEAEIIEMRQVDVRGDGTRSDTGGNLKAKKEEAEDPSKNEGCNRISSSKAENLGSSGLNNRHQEQRKDQSSSGKETGEYEVGKPKRTDVVVEVHSQESLQRKDVAESSQTVSKESEQL